MLTNDKFIIVRDSLTMLKHSYLKIRNVLYHAS